MIYGIESLSQINNRGPIRTVRSIFHNGILGAISGIFVFILSFLSGGKVDWGSLQQRFIKENTEEGPNKFWFDYDLRMDQLTLGLNFSAFQYLKKCLTEVTQQRDSFVGLVDSEDFFPGCPGHFEIGLDGSKVLLSSGREISASRDVWKKVLTKWDQEITENEPKLIVFDRFEKDWCDPNSNGRFLIMVVA